MNYSYNSLTFPFQYSGNPYITNGYSTTQQPGPQPPIPAPVSVLHPVPPHGPPPPGYPVHGVPGTQGVASNTAAMMYPYPLSGAPYPNPNVNPSVPFDGNWTYNYTSTLGHFPDIRQQQNGVCTSAPSSQIVSKTNFVKPTSESD